MLIPRVLYRVDTPEQFSVVGSFGPSVAIRLKFCATRYSRIVGIVVDAQIRRYEPVYRDLGRRDGYGR